MTGEIYGHISKRLMSDLKKTTPTGIELYSVYMVKATFVDSFNYADHTFYIHQYKNGNWDVVEKFTGLSACQHGDNKVWATREKAIEKAMDNFKKYEKTGDLKTRLAISYRDWKYTKSSSTKMSAQRLIKLKKL